MRSTITAFLRQKFPNNATAESHFGELLAEYAESGLSPPHIIAEIETGDDGKFWSYLWEAILYKYLHSKGFAPSNTIKVSGQEGPDFCVKYRSRKIWIEATVPAPNGIPDAWLAPPRQGEVVVKTKPDKERVLRCMSGIKDKRDKFNEYRQKGIVGEGDCTVIAVNICRLSDYDLDGNGISQLPLVMEAVFPIGPIAVPISTDGKLDGRAQHVPRFSVAKPSGKEIETGFFLDRSFANVSAVIQAHQRDLLKGDLNLTTVHNPIANNGLPEGLLGASKEFVAERCGDKFVIGDIRAASA